MNRESATYAAVFAALAAISTVVVIAALALMSNSVGAVEAGTMDVDSDQLAKIAKQKAKRPANSNQGGPVDSSALNGNIDSPCGNVEIGNVTSNGPHFGGPKEVTVIVTGDVINAGNNCRR